MAVSNAVRQLLRIRDLEETLRRREVESVQGELAQLELALRVAGDRQRNGRNLIASGVQSEDLRDRMAGLEEVRAGKVCSVVLKQRIDESTLLVEELRAALLAKRVERKQAETLVKTTEAREADEADRRIQQSLDDWYLTHLPENHPR
jgi:hypothetical protein